MIPDSIPEKKGKNSQGMGIAILLESESTQPYFYLTLLFPIFSTFLLPTFHRKERATAALTEMGPAIFNGGLTTFLALFLLAFSNYYAYTVFFRVSRVRAAAVFVDEKGIT